MTEILSISTLRNYTTNECIFFRGSDPEFCYIILDGSVLQTELTAAEYFKKFTSTKNVNRKVEHFYLENVKINNKGNQIFKLGDVFGIKNLINEKQYIYTCLSKEKNTALLLIPKDFFIQKMKEKIVTTDDNLKKMICRSFHIFVQMGKKIFEKYFNKMIKLFPRYGEFIINSQQKADSLFIIFQGNYVINDKNYGDLILLTEGEMFGCDSLNDNENDKKYTYNIISKVTNGVILQFKIENLSKYYLTKIKNQLSDYFNQRKIFIIDYINRQKNLRNELSKKYELIGTVKNNKKKDFNIKNKNHPNDSNLLGINESFFNKIVESIQLAKSKKIKCKRNFKFNIKNTKISKLNINNKNKNKFYSPEIKNPFKIFKDDEQSSRNKLVNLLDNKKTHQKVSSFNKINTTNNNIYVTSVETIPTEAFSYTNTNANLNYYEKISGKTLSFRNKIMMSKDFEKKRRNNSLKKTGIYEYIKNSVNYFNDGGIKYTKSKLCKVKRPLSSKFFYDTHKYNIPLYVFCDSKEKNLLKIDDIMNYKL